jgi:hypothetical protein
MSVTVYRGQATTLYGTVSGIGSLSGVALYFMAKRAIGDADSAAVLNKSTANGGVRITGPLTFEVDIAATDTAFLAAAGNDTLPCDVQAVMPNGTRYELLLDAVVVKRPVRTG